VIAALAGEIRGDTGKLVFVGMPLVLRCFFPPFKFLLCSAQRSATVQMKIRADIFIGRFTAKVQKGKADQPELQVRPSQAPAPCLRAD